MLIKKIAVPLVNEKLLAQAEHCYIATAAISSEGFDFIRSRIPSKTKMDIVTGLDYPTAPDVMNRILKHYQERIQFRIFHRNHFHANVYIIDLPFRKSVAFIGSGSCTLGGLKDNEEIFSKTTDPKEIEALKSWFIGYFEFAEPITENLVSTYEKVYYQILQREIASAKDKQRVIEIASRGFNFDHIKFKNQFFKKEDYSPLQIDKCSSSSPVVQEERIQLQQKFQALWKEIEREVQIRKLFFIKDASVHGTELNQSPARKIYQLGFAFGKSEGALKKLPAVVSIRDFICFQVILQQTTFSIQIAADEEAGMVDRERMKTQLDSTEYTARLHQEIMKLEKGYLLEIGGVSRTSDSFSSVESVSDFFRKDHWKYFSFTVSRSYSPGDPEISTEKIFNTIIKQLDVLLHLYNLLTSESD